MFSYIGSVRTSVFNLLINSSFGLSASEAIFKLSTLYVLDPVRFLYPFSVAVFWIDILVSFMYLSLYYFTCIFPDLS